MRMSPLSSSGISDSIRSSTAGPALTIIIILRGLARFFDQLFERVAADELLALRPAGDELVDLARRAVEHGDACSRGSRC